MTLFIALGFLLSWRPCGSWGSVEYALLRAEGSPGPQWDTIAVQLDTTYTETAVDVERRYFYTVLARKPDSLKWGSPSDTMSAAIVEVSQGLPPRRIYSFRGERDGLELLVVYVPEAGPWSIEWTPIQPEINAPELVTVRCAYDTNGSGIIDLSDMVAFYSRPHSAQQARDFAALYRKRAFFLVPIAQGVTP